MATRRTLLLAALLFVCGAMPAESVELRALYLYPSVRQFNWEESDSSGRLLKEQGVIYGAGVVVAIDLIRTGAGALTATAKGELSGGLVDYDGQTQPPSSIPLQTDVTYLGAKEELQLGWTVAQGSLLLQPFAGVGYRWWLRDLHDTVASNGTTHVQGYTEEWQMLYGRTGLAAEYRLSENWRLFGATGATYPFYTGNSVDVAGSGDITLKPESRWSPFGELGLRYKNFRPSIFYEGVRLGRSPLARVNANNAFYQPDSREDVIGVDLAWCFR